MSKRPFVHRLRDRLCFAAAVAMVLYVTIADHRPIEPGAGQPGAERVASAAPGTLNR